MGISQPFKKDSAPPVLRINGFYKWVRHPLYTFSILYFIAAPAMTQNGASFAIGAAFYFYIGAIYEERKLERVFGEAYVNYKKHTPMLIPGVRMLK